jgi:hypothetical protein
VNPPKIGSRVGVLYIGGILRVYADLRREIKWGNLKWGFFGVLLVCPRRTIEEGGHLCVFCVQLGEFWG